jgi:hypothetical protein
VVIDRRRIVFATGEERMVFHRAEGVGLAAARALITEVQVATEANAQREIARFVADLARDGVSVRAAVTAAATSKLPEKLEDILRVHARMHAAEGNFYRDVVATACEACGLQVHRVVERETPALMGDLLGINFSMLEARLKEMGRTLGPPWSEDYKLAAQAAWLHLDGDEA